MEITLNMNKQYKWNFEKCMAGGTHPTEMHSCFCSSSEGSHSDWKNGKAFSSQGKVREF